MFTLYNLCGKPSNDQTLQVIEQRGALILGYFLVCCLSVLIDLSLDCLHRNLTLIHAVVFRFFPRHLFRTAQVVFEGFVIKLWPERRNAHGYIWLYFA